MVAVPAAAADLELTFPTDVGGPSTTLCTGRAVINIDPSGTWTVTLESGTSIDICARLAATG